jgi:hypothetical protein
MRVMDWLVCFNDRVGQRCVLHFLVGVDIVNAECLMTNGMARTERCRNRARTTIAARGTREMVVVVTSP